MKYKLSYLLDEDEGEKGRYGVTIFEEVREDAITGIDNFIETFYAPSWEDARKKAIEYLKELEKMPKDEIIDIKDEQ